MMMNLRKQTRETKVYAKVSVFCLQQNNHNYHNNLLTPNQQSKIDLKQNQSKQIYSLSQNKIDQKNEIIHTNENKGQKYFKFQPVKYKQQLKLQNLQRFDIAIKQENSSIIVVQMMIEQNYNDELKDYQKKNQNFSLNFRNTLVNKQILIVAQSGIKNYQRGTHQFIMQLYIYFMILLIYYYQMEQIHRLKIEMNQIHETRIKNYFKIQ
ncbi:unnamed protein product [Paramecium primaurelia]|uniref:Transmembrane protein n=1 Tax=Paramecium primaurelia TaxID=5886 RepID=A0A8S1KDD4_PARPR|nr:unnamed protein product [Paramecium primaurelia]